MQRRMRNFSPVAIVSQALVILGPNVEAVSSGVVESALIAHSAKRA